MADPTQNPHDPFDGGRWGENHSPNENGGDHHTLFRGDSHISWDADEDGDYITGSGHETDHDTGQTTNWGP